MFEVGANPEAPVGSPQKLEAQLLQLQQAWVAPEIYAAVQKMEVALSKSPVEIATITEQVVILNAVRPDDTKLRQAIDSVIALSMKGTPGKEEVQSCIMQLRRVLPNKEELAFIGIPS